MHSTKPKKHKLKRVAIRNKIAKEFSELDFSKIDLLCPSFDEFKYNYQEEYYRSSPSFEVLCLYVLYLENRVAKLESIGDSLLSVNRQLMAETLEDDNFGIGDI